MTGRASDLFGPVAGDLSTVEAELKKEIHADPSEVGGPMADLFDAGGKRIRPALVLLSAMCGSYHLDRLTPAAMAVELTHAATLVHDDVIDRAAVRRGRPTVAAKLGDEPAIVIGDYYFAKAYENAARTESAEVVAILARTVMAICAGEVRQQGIRYRYDTDVSEYMRRIEAKTAMLLAACCEIGAVLGALDDRHRVALRAYGMELGLAFQIADDVLDYTATTDEVGKPIGHDIAEGFATLPLMLAGIEIASNKKLSDDEARRIADEVRRSKGPQLALDQARHHADAARENLSVFDSGEAIATLESLADYVITRKL